MRDICSHGSVVVPCASRSLPDVTRHPVSLLVSRVAHLRPVSWPDGSPCPGPPSWMRYETTRAHYLLHHGGLVRHLVRDQPDGSADAHPDRRFSAQPGNGGLPAVLLLSGLRADLHSCRSTGGGTRPACNLALRLFL